MSIEYSLIVAIILFMKKKSNARKPIFYSSIYWRNLTQVPSFSHGRDQNNHDQEALDEQG